MNKLSIQVSATAFLGSLASALAGGWVATRTNDLALTLVVIFAILGVTLAVTIPRMVRGFRALGVPPTKPSGNQSMLATLLALWICGTFALTAAAYAWTGSRVAEGAVAFILGPLGAVLVMRLRSAVEPAPAREMAGLLRASAFMQLLVGVVFAALLLLRLLLHRASVGGSDLQPQNLLDAAYFTVIPLSLVSAYFQWKRSHDARPATAVTN